MSKSRSSAHLDTRTMIICALLAALSIVLGKLLAINITQNFRLSFENLPILMAGMIFGPVTGAVVGAVADLIGCLIAGYAVNPLITLGGVLIGFLGGLLHRCGVGGQKCSTFLAVFTAHIVGSMIVKSLGLHFWYGTPFSVLWLRIPLYLIIAALESLILCFLQQNPTICRYFKGDAKS